MFLGWIYEYIFAVAVSAVLLLYNIYCFIGMLKIVKDNSVFKKLNIYLWIVNKISGKSTNKDKKRKILTKLARKINIGISGICLGTLITNIIMLCIIYTLNIQATNISNILSTLFNKADCNCYAKCTGNEEDDAKTAYELLFGPDEYSRFTVAITSNIMPSDAQPFIDMLARGANGKEQGEWLIAHLNDEAVQCYKSIVGNNNKFRSGDHQDRSQMTNAELRDDLIALLKDYKVGGRNPNCDRCFDTEDRKLATNCLGEAHWVKGWTWEAIWDSDNPGDGTVPNPGDGSGGGGGNIAAKDSQYGIELDGEWYYWYHQSSTHDCANNVNHSTYGRYGATLLYFPNKELEKNRAGSRGCSTYSTAMAVSNALGREITPYTLLIDLMGGSFTQRSDGIWQYSGGTQYIDLSQAPPYMNKQSLANLIQNTYYNDGIRTEYLSSLSQSKIDEILAKGGYIVASWYHDTSKGMAWYPKLSSGSGSHFMVIRKKDANGLYYCLNSAEGHDFTRSKSGITYSELVNNLKNPDGYAVWNENPPSTNPGEGDGGGKPGTGGDGSYAGQIIDRMADAGYGKYSIAGALGSFAAESGLDPKKTQGNACNGADNATVRAWQGGASGRAIGFAQWDGSRAINLLNAADAAGVAWYDFNFQLNFYMAELSSQGYSVTSANSNCVDVEHAAWFFTKTFERCGTCKYAPCSGSNYGKISNGAHGVGNNAADISFENRNHMNGWNTRNSKAQEFYNTHLK